MAKIIVSACLLGFKCRYKGDDCKNEAVLKLAEKHTLIPVCPEQMGGLPTPRDPSEIVGEKVVSCAGRDVTPEYQKGAKAALDVALLSRAGKAVLKAKSPSCGCGVIYDGTFSGGKIPGNGITARLLLENGIKVFTEDDVEAGKVK